MGDAPITAGREGASVYPASLRRPDCLLSSSINLDLRSVTEDVENTKVVDLNASVKALYEDASCHDATFT